MRTVPQPTRPHVPTRQQNSPYGQQNPLTGARPLPLPSVPSRGIAQPREHFQGSGLPANVQRALEQVQENLRAALSQVKTLPFADGNLCENVPLIQGALAMGGPTAASLTLVTHGLHKPVRGVIAMATRGGFLTATPTIVAQSDSNLSTRQVALWLQYTAFTPGGGPALAVTGDFWVYA